MVDRTDSDRTKTRRYKLRKWSYEWLTQALRDAERRIKDIESEIERRTATKNQREE